MNYAEWHMEKQGVFECETNSIDSLLIQGGSMESDPIDSTEPPKAPIPGIKPATPADGSN